MSIIPNTGIPNFFASKIPILSQKSGFLLKESGFAMAEADCDLYIISPEFSLNPAQQKLRKAVEVNT